MKISPIKNHNLKFGITLSKNEEYAATKEKNGKIRVYIYETDSISTTLDETQVIIKE